MKRLLGTAILLTAVMALAEPVCVKEWVFDKAETVAEWAKATNHVADIRFEEGAMVGTISDWDPWLTSPEVRFKATPWQYVEVEMKSDLGGSGQIFFTDTNDTQYNGFYSDRFASFPIKGDNEWRTIVVNPFWQFETILKLRLDFATSHRPEDKGQRMFAVRRIRVMDPGYDKLPLTVPQWDFANRNLGWKSVSGEDVTVSSYGITPRCSEPQQPIGIELKPVNFSVEDYGCWLCVEMACFGAEKATVTWLSTNSHGLRRKTFSVNPDGEKRFYNIDMSSEDTWGGNLYLLSITLNGKKASLMTVRSVAVNESPAGPAQLVSPGRESRFGHGRCRRFEYRAI